MPETKTPEAKKLTLKDYKSEVVPDWCPGCGDFGVLASIQKAAAELGIPPHDIVTVSGIGCSSNLPGFFRSYGAHSLHGRSVAVASGILLGNHTLKVVVTGGDGDGYGIGIGHFIHAMRRNLNLTYVVMDNQVYGLTTGQFSPTSEKGMTTKIAPSGNPESPINPISLALVSGASYVARGFSGEQAHLSKLIAGAIAHPGFALVDVFSPCVTYNHLNTYPWFRERVYKLEDQKHDTSNMKAAMERSQEYGDRIPIGVFYKIERPTYEGQEPALQEGPLARRKLGMTNAEGRKLLEENM